MRHDMVWVLCSYGFWLYGISPFGGHGCIGAALGR